MPTLKELKKQQVELEKKIAIARKDERTEALKKVKELCKEFGFTAGMLKGTLAAGRKSKYKS